MTRRCRAARANAWPFSGTRAPATSHCVGKWSRCWPSRRQWGAFSRIRPVATAAPMVSEPGASVLTGRRLGAYEVRERIGVGGMGEVYRARDTKFGRDVAIKILPRHFTSDPERLARFEREARVLASLNHPHIGAIYGVGRRGRRARAGARAGRRRDAGRAHQRGRAADRRGPAPSRARSPRRSTRRTRRASSTGI